MTVNAAPLIDITEDPSEPGHVGGVGIAETVEEVVNVEDAVLVLVEVVVAVELVDAEGVEDSDVEVEVEMEESDIDVVEEVLNGQFPTNSVTVEAVKIVAVLYSVVTEVPVYSVSAVVNDGWPSREIVVVVVEDSKIVSVRPAEVSKTVVGTVGEYAVSVTVVEGSGLKVIVMVDVPEVWVMKLVVAGAGANVVDGMAVS